MRHEILVVDDNPQMLVYMSYLFQNPDITYKSFERPSEALSYLEQLTDPELPSFVISDMRTIPELDGPEKLFNYINERGIANRFYFMTGNVSPYDEEVAQRTGAPIIPKDDINISKAREMSSKLV